MLDSESQATATRTGSLFDTRADLPLAALRTATFLASRVLCMSSAFEACARSVSDLHLSLLELEQSATALQLLPLGGREWFQLLEQKLLPQLNDSAYLVAAVCGGTNIGKSVIFNHLAGTKASAVTALASGTKHPVCLVPTGFETTHDLSTIFPGFELQAWESSEAALRESDRSLLFWRSAESLPPNLLVLDSPDIDSDARVNWERADMIRRAADVLIAVLTQQKYNDAAVKEFFRRAAAEDKVVLIVFNQVHLPDDEEYWPLWLQTFCSETGIVPHVIYLTPHHRKAAEENRLPFFERQLAPAALSVEAGAVTTPTSDPQTNSDNDAATAPPAADNVGRRLNEDLSALRFGEIKLRTLSGSLRLLLDAAGAAGYLSEVESRAREFRTAGELLSAHQLAEVDNWPTVPNSLIVQHIRGWWQQQRAGWSATVHGFYNRIGSHLTAGYRFVYEKVAGPSVAPIETYKLKEWDAVLNVVDEVYDRLQWFLELGNPLLQPRLSELLGATTRQDLIAALKNRHEVVDLEADLQDLIVRELESFRSENPQFYKSLKQLDAVAAAARPATSIALFVTGFGPIGHLATDAALTSAVHLTGDVVAGGITAAVGENWLSQTASTGAAWLEARFRRIHERFAEHRANWLAEFLQQHLLGTLPHDLRAAAQIPELKSFERVRSSLNELQSEVGLTADRKAAL